MILINESAYFTNKQKEDSFLLMQQHMKGRFFIGRLSGNETRLTGLVLNNKPIENKLIQNMLYVAGIQFKTKEDMKTYIKLYNTSCKNTTLLGVWDGSMYNQAIDYYNFINKAYSIKQICAHAVEPYYYMNDSYIFPSLFINKKVLIITSHYETTNKQIKKQMIPFTKPIFHETTEYYIYKPPQQNGGSHDNESWIVHYEKMKEDIVKIKTEFNFNIALVSCGGFGMIISDYIFSLGSNVMYVGGALQLFFGIMGSRWENSIKTNEMWTRPCILDIPKNPELCENKCYW